MKKLILLLCLFASAYAQDKQKCGATTTKGTACKNPAQAGDTRCYLHSDKTPHCGVLTAKKTPCKMVVKKAGDHCWRHQ